MFIKNKLGETKCRTIKKLLNGIIVKKFKRNNFAWYFFIQLGTNAARGRFSNENFITLKSLQVSFRN